MLHEELFTDNITVDDYSLTFKILRIDSFKKITKREYYDHFIGQNDRLRSGVDMFLSALDLCSALKTKYEVPSFIAAMYVNQTDTTKLPDLITTFRIIEKYSLVEPHGIVGTFRNPRARPRSCSLLLHSFLSRWSRMKYFFVKPTGKMVRILLEELKLGNQWIPIAIGFQNDVEDVDLNWDNYWNAYSKKYPLQVQRKFMEKIMDVDIFKPRRETSYVYTWILERQNDNGYFASPIVVDWEQDTVVINNKKESLRPFKELINTDDPFFSPYKITYWGNEHYDKNEEETSWFGTPHFTINVSDLIKYWELSENGPRPAEDKKENATAKENKEEAPAKTNPTPGRQVTIRF